ncbi:MAG: hypothetical protein ACLP8A_08685 [Methylovirgula sp.]
MADDHQAEDSAAEKGAHDAAADMKAEPIEGATSEASSAAPTVSVMGTTTPPRTKSVIEAEAIRTGGEAGAGEFSGEPADRFQTAPAEPDTTDAIQTEPVSEPVAPRRRGSIWPLAAAIVLGAAIAVGGAYGLHRLDKTGPSTAVLETRIAALEQTTSAVPALQSGAAALSQKLDALEAKTQATDAALAKEQESLAALTDTVKTLPKSDSSAPPPSAQGAPAATADLGPLTGRVDKLEQQLAALDQRVTALATKFDTDMQAVQAQKDATAQAVMTHTEADARAILAGTLRRKVDAGEAYADDLAAIANHGADKDQIAVLAPFAATGVATPRALAKQFAAIAPDLLATGAPSKSKSFFGRLAEDAAHLVRIRKIGDTEGTDVSAEVARISAALATDRLDDALREWNGLSAAAKAKSQGFAEALRHRIAAAAAAKAIEAEALAALAKAKS